MPPYNSSEFDPPAPVARITLRNPIKETLFQDVLMLLDTGADITLIPRYAAQHIAISTSESQNYELVGFDGSTSSAQAVQAEVIFSGHIFRGQFLLIDQEWGIIGRNILNAMPLLFDGPKLNWDEYHL